jgi:pimeloyl-ACP methyl ester carboxylesterase
MEPAGSERALVIGVSEGAPMALLYAAMYPSRVPGLVVYGGFSHATGPEEAEPPAKEDLPPIDEARTGSEWGSDARASGDLAVLAPSRQGDPAFRDWFRKLGRYAGSPKATADLARMNRKIDVRSKLSSIQAPTLILHVRGDRDVPVAEGRELAERIAGSQFVELPGEDHRYFANREATEAVARNIRDFVSELRPAGEENRVVASVLFTDVVNSTG